MTKINVIYLIINSIYQDFLHVLHGDIIVCKS